MALAADRVCTGHAVGLVLGACVDISAWPGPVGDDSGGWPLYTSWKYVNFYNTILYQVEEMMSNPLPIHRI